MCVPAFGQSKLNPAGRHALTIYKQEALKSRAAVPPTVTMLVRLDEEADAAVLTEAGYEVVGQYGPVALVSAAITEAENLASMKQVRSISFGNKRRMLMKAARTAAEVDRAHTGITSGDVTQAFTGEGVILGLMDTGVYPGHINFDGRVERVWNFTADDGTYNEYSGSAIGGFSTDTESESHGTHVAGIMAGGYRGNVTTHNGSGKVTGAFTHYGVAPGASLALSCGELDDPNILQGVENVINYAEAQGKPVAVNLSLGSNGGPHDGTDDFSVALVALGERALICVAAGNEGADNMSIEKTFTATDKTVSTLLYYNSNYVDANYGTLDIWGDDGETFTVSISSISSTGDLTNTVTIPASTNGEEVKLGSGVRSGQVYYYSGVDPNNGRYNVYLYFNGALPPRNWRFAISVTGKAGHRVNMYFDGYSTFTDSYSSTTGPISGYIAGTPDNSINAMGCGSNVITVGAFSTTSSWRSLDGLQSSTSETVGDYASFSSYGHDFSGRQLPEISAPGTAIMSSFSSPYIEGGYGDDYYESSTDMVASVKNGTTTYYWGPMEGTSMACPFVTGTMGLWLQADPTLTVDDVREVMRNTSTTDSYTAAAPERFGYGKINAAKGLEYILAKASLGTVTADPARAVSILPTAGGYDVTVAGAARVAVTLADMQGRVVARSEAQGNRLSIDASGLAAGIYVMNVAADNLNYSAKVVRRLQ